MWWGILGINEGLQEEYIKVNVFRYFSTFLSDDRCFSSRVRAAGGHIIKIFIYKSSTYKTL